MRIVILVAVAVLLYAVWPSALGLFGPDEPRYASIARHMAASGDWISPVLNGKPWLEKPALLYWMGGLGFRMQLGPEAAPRLPVAVLSVAFIAFFYWRLRRRIGAEAAFAAAGILATCAGWIGYSNIAVTDVPLAVWYAAGMLLALEWIEEGSARKAALAGACFGMAMLAKGLVPVVLAAPLVWFARRRWRQWPVIVGATLVVAAPWYTAVTMRHGWAFFDEFFLEHHFSRFAKGDLQHVQPFWFYLPVLAALLLPWAPLLFTRETWRDPARRFFAVWLVFGFVFFSASKNKLPGYLIPLLPAAVLMMRTPGAAWLRGGMAAMVALILLTKANVPAALRAQTPPREAAMAAPEDACTDLPRSKRYGAEYYAGRALPECWEVPGAVRLEDGQGGPGDRLRVLVTLPGSGEPVSGRLLFFASPRRTQGELVLPVASEPNLVWVSGREVFDWRPGTERALDPNAIAFPGPFASAGSGDWLLMVLFDPDHSFPRTGMAAGDRYSAVIPLPGREPGAAQTVRFSLDHVAPASASTLPAPVRVPSPSLSRRLHRPVTLTAWPGGPGTEALLYLPDLGEDPRRRDATVLDPLDGNLYHAFVDSAANGPWGKALVAELLPALKLGERPRLSGRGLGGWAALWLKQAYPEAFGEVEAIEPAPPDFTQFWGIDLSARPAQVFLDPQGKRWPHPSIPGFSLAESALQEAVEGTESGRWRAMEGLFGPATSDGPPRQLFDRGEGKTDPVVIDQWLKMDLARLYQEKKIDARGVTVRARDAASRAFCAKTGARCVID